MFPIIWVENISYKKNALLKKINKIIGIIKYIIMSIFIYHTFCIIIIYGTWRLYEIKLIFSQILGFQLYVMLIEVFEAEKSRIRWYYSFAYGTPFIIVSVSCLIDPFSYGTDRYCWLRADNFFIFSFVGPVITVILVSI